MIVKTGVDPETVVTSVVALLEASDKTKPTASWDKNWNAYHGNYDWSDKESWQSQLALPKLFTAVERITGTIRRAMLAQRWYTMSPRMRRDEKDMVWAQIAQQLLDWWLSKSADAPSAVAQAFKTSLLSSMLCVLVDMYDVPRTLVRPGPAGRETETIVEKKLEFTNIDPNNVYVDSSGRNRFMIWEEYVDLSDLENLPPDGGWINLDRVRTNEGEAPAETDDTQPDRRTCKLTHFYGDLWDMNDGSLIGNDLRVLLVNRSFMIREVEDNPYWDQDPPLVVAPFIDVPFSTWHIPFLQPARPIAGAEQELINLIIDATMLAALPGVVLDETVLESLNAEEAISPLKVWKRRGTIVDPKSPGVVPIGFPGSRPEVIQVAYLLDRIFSEASTQTEFEAGLPSRRTRTTASERELSLQMSSLFTGDLASSAESRFVTRILEKAWSRIIQFQPDVPGEVAPSLDEILGEQKAQLWQQNMQQNYRAMALDYVFNVNGISKYMEKIQRAQTILSVLRIIGRSEMLMQKINMSSLLTELFANLDIELNLEPTPNASLAEALGVGVGGQ